MQRVFVVDDDDAIRASLKMLLASDGLEAIPFAGGAQFLDGCGEDPAGCALMDLHMPGMDGLEVQEALLTRNICLPVIFLTGHGSVNATVRAMRAGAVDFLEKPYSSEILLARVHEALATEREWRADREHFATLRSRLDSLTPREQEVLRHVSLGAASKVIAVDLNISERTVELHRARVMKKLGFRTLGNLMREMVAYEQHVSTRIGATGPA